MPILLTCITEPGTEFSCCEAPYVATTSDCVLDCLVRQQVTVTRDLRGLYAGMLSFGTSGATAKQDQLQDMQLLTTLLYDLFLERVYTVTGGGSDWSVEDIWEEHQLQCVSDYFFCRYKLDIRPWLLHAGLYDPKHPPAQSVIDLLPIPYEIPCGDGQPVPPDPPDPLVPNCLIETFMIVAGAVDSSLEGTLDANSSYLIISNELNGSGGWNDHVGEIAVPGGYVTPPDPSNIGISGSDQIWTVAGGISVPLFQPIHASAMGQQIYLTQMFPPIGATILVEITDDVTWETAYNGPDNAIVSPFTTTLASVTGIRTTYLYDECPYGPFGGTVENACGSLIATSESIAGCDDGTFTMEITVTEYFNYELGFFIIQVDGVDQAPVPIVLGTTVFGPYLSTQIVTATVISNGMNSLCNVDLGQFSFISDNFPAVDHSVETAQDASFEGSAVPGTSYLVVSDNTNAGNTWASHVGEIWDGSGWITVQEGGLVGTNVPSGYPSLWQMTSGSIVQVYGAPLFVYNTVTLVWIVDPPPVATIVAGVTVEVGYACGANPPVVLFTGPIEDLVQIGFTPDCPFGEVTGYMRYVTDCPVTVDAVIEQFTPNGEVDPEFYGSLNNIPFAFAPQEAGAFLAGGAFTEYDPDGSGVLVPIIANRYARFDRNGEIDMAYNNIVNNTSSSVPGFNNTVYGIKVQSTGKVVIVGGFTTFNDEATPFICRLNTDGTLDAAFMANVGAGFNGFSAFGCELQGDDKIIVVGQFTTYDGVAAARIVRLNADGTRDNTFVGTAAPISLRNVALAPDDTIVVNGSANGSFTTYQGNGQAVVPVLTINDNFHRTLVRINTGSGANIAAVPGSMDSVVAQGDQIQVSGPPFFSNKFFILGDGSIIQLGSIEAYDGDAVGRIVKLSSSGVMDPTFFINSGVGFSTETVGGDVLPNGQLLIGCLAGGTYPNNAGVPVNQFCLARLNSDGTLDESWNIGPAGFNGSVFTVMVDSFGGIVVGGAFTHFNGIPRGKLLRFPGYV